MGRILFGLTAGLLLLLGSGTAQAQSIVGPRPCTGPVVVAPSVVSYRVHRGWYPRGWNHRYYGHRYYGHRRHR